VRALVERRERLATFRRDRDQALAAVVRRARFLQQAVLAEAAQDAAEIAVVEVEVGGERARRHLLAVGELVEHARFREREARVDQALAQQAELAGVEAGEAPHRGDALLQTVRSRQHGHLQIGDSVNQLLDGVKYLSRSPA
jgi:hypothetical protein